MDMFIVLLTQDQVGVQHKIPNKTEWFQLLLWKDFHDGEHIRWRKVEWATEWVIIQNLSPFAVIIGDLLS